VLAAAAQAALHTRCIFPLLLIVLAPLLLTALCDPSGDGDPLVAGLLAGATGAVEVGAVGRTGSQKTAGVDTRRTTHAQFYLSHVPHRSEGTTDPHDRPTQPTEHTDRTHRPNTPTEHTDRPNTPIDRTDRTARTDRTDRIDRSTEQTDRPNRPNKPIDAAPDSPSYPHPPN
jgi:hypothetical protein